MKKPSPFFSTQKQIRFRDADPAGIMFYGNILGLCHDVFEDFLPFLGITWNEWFVPQGWGCPIRHVEVNYLSPLIAGHIYTVQVRVVKVGKTSFSMFYRFMGKDNKEHAHAKITHAFVNLESGSLNPEKSKISPRPIPAVFRDRFEKQFANYESETQ